MSPAIDQNKQVVFKIYDRLIKYIVKASRLNSFNSTSLDIKSWQEFAVELEIIFSNWKVYTGTIWYIRSRENVDIHLKSHYLGLPFPKVSINRFTFSSDSLLQVVLYILKLVFEMLLQGSRKWIHSNGICCTSLKGQDDFEHWQRIRIHFWVSFLYIVKCARKFWDIVLRCVRHHTKREVDARYEG
jgi:hypothetical protein